MVTAEQVKHVLKNNVLGTCPAKKLSYAVLMDSLRNIFNPYLSKGGMQTKEIEIKWFFDDAYGRQVDKLGGCSFDFCCLSLDISHETLRKVVKALLESKELRDKYLLTLFINLFIYNNIYYNIYNNK